MYRSAWLRNSSSESLPGEIPALKCSEIVCLNQAVGRPSGPANATSPEAIPCPFRKLGPTILMVKSAQDVACDDAAAALNGPAMWGVFLQAEMGACRVVIRSVFFQDTRRRWASLHTIMWSRHSRRIEPIARSTYPFCHGDRGAIGRSAA